MFAPHELVYSRSCVDQVRSMFDTTDMRLLRHAAQTRIQRLQRVTRSSLIHALTGRQKVQVSADIYAPSLMLADNLQDPSKGSLLLVDLGLISFGKDNTHAIQVSQNPPPDLDKEDVDKFITTPAHTMTDTRVTTRASFQTVERESSSTEADNHGELLGIGAIHQPNPITKHLLSPSHSSRSDHFVSLVHRIGNPAAVEAMAQGGSAGGGGTSCGLVGGRFTEDDWELKVTGVQVVVVTNATNIFEGGHSVGGGSSLLGDKAPDNERASHFSNGTDKETAVVEKFDLFIKVRTRADAVTNKLLGAKLQANLPRLSFNLHNSAYLLLARLFHAGEW
ncbi:unnamed protein product [Choristocarpus tenellus]